MGQKKEQRIGIFDSGIGGFSILKEIHKSAPHLKAYYIADDAFAPYGSKSADEIIQRSKYIVEELLKFDVELIVVACNTATAFAIDYLRDHYSVSFVGVEPFLNAIDKFNWTREDKSCVITTELMSKSVRFNDLKLRYDKFNQLDYFVTKNLATIIEKYFSQLDKQELMASLEDEFSIFDKSAYKYIILGCTHYPLIGREIEAITGLAVISPCPYVARRVVSLIGLDGNETAESSSFEFTTTKASSPLRFVSKDFSSLP
ncbi:glutamate racemase [Halobacteriovorax sp. HLS]|uniref:glutamate racemase n=1 Tax=Halobacteriovorax sp. HLS TaxID=2234000 RepID=UPI000FD947FC|nr:aspartate/glutamate racemase family protein [Halobacteriovorax sp. HLS]